MPAIHALLIDDNEENLSVLASLLRRQQATTTVIASPQRLTDHLRTIAPVDVVFLDLEMPGLDGYDVLALLKADPRFQAVPIVACTVHLNEVTTAHSHGFHSFIGKPLDATRFPDQLSRILCNEAVWEPA